MQQIQHPKVVVIGAGSLFFGRQAIWQMVHSPHLNVGTLGLVDTDPERLEKLAKLAEMVIADVRVKIDKTYPAFVGEPRALNLTVKDSETGEPVGARFGLYELKTGWSPKADK